MTNVYARWILRREQRMHQRDNNRRVRPFDWGLDYLGLERGSAPPRELLLDYARHAYAESESFFAPAAFPAYTLRGNHLTYPSAIQNCHAENNTVHCRWFSVPGARVAVVVLPNWNAKAESHVALCRLLNRHGMSALRLSLPYHDERRPPELERADYLVDANIGRTLQANRQAVLDTRLAVEWLGRQGFARIGLLGTSIGASVSFLAFSHEPRIGAAIFNHASSYFADVVWEGLTTRHVREGLEGQITLSELRECWKAISPLPFVSRLRDQNRPNLIISARYDPTFLPRLTQDFLDEYDRHGIPLRKVLLPCGHYTLGVFPFNWIDGWIMTRFLKRTLDFAGDLH